MVAAKNEMNGEVLNAFNNRNVVVLKKIIKTSTSGCNRFDGKYLMTVTYEFILRKGGKYISCKNLL